MPEATTAPSVSAGIIAQNFRLTGDLLPIALSDVSEETACHRTRNGEGPSLLWLVGHMLHCRYQVLNMLGAAKESPYPQFQQGAPQNADQPKLADLVHTWDEAAAWLKEAIESASSDKLNEASPIPGLHGEQTVLDAVMFLAWHEAYHMGALGAVRKELGLPGLADLVMAKAKAGA